MTKLPALAIACASLASLVACDMSLAHGLGGDSRRASAAAPRAGCRLNIATHVATCPCATGADFDELPDRPDLDALDAEIHPAADPSRLAQLPSLHALALRNVSQVQLVGIAKMQQLDALAVTTREKIDLATIGAMTNLRSLSITLGSGARICDVAPLARLEHLEKLTLRLECAHEIDVAPLATLANLRDLTVDGVFPSADLASKLPKTAVVIHDRSDDAGSICDLDPERVLDEHRMQMRTSRRLLICLLAVCAAAGFVACGTDFTILGASDGGDGNAGDGASRTDAEANGDGAPAADAAGSLGDGAKDADARGDAGDAGDSATVAIFCPPIDASVNACGACAGFPLHCALCKTQGGAIDHICTPTASSCEAQYARTGDGFCTCPNLDASACPLSTQVCNPTNNGLCAACGENLTDGYACKGGGNCSQAKGACQ